MNQNFFSSQVSLVQKLLDEYWFGRIIITVGADAVIDPSSERPSSFSDVSCRAITTRQHIRTALR